MGKYLTKEELKASDTERNKLNKFISPSVRHKFSLANVNHYCNNFFSGNKNISILDCGTASGAFAKELKDAGFCNIYGLDLDDFLNSDNRFLFKDFKTADLNYDSISYADNFFEMVTAWCVVPHLENPHNFIREVHRILRRGGGLL